MAIINGTENNDRFGPPDNPESNDTVSLGGGNDSFTTGNGYDTVYGGSGADTIRDYPGSSSGSTIYGESGDDSLDVIFSGASKLYGGDGFDTVSGGFGDDTILGGNNNDTLEGRNGNDRLYGEASNDWIKGDSGNDILSGGIGDDTLTGSVSIARDRDTMFGGEGADTFDLGDSYRFNTDSDLAIIEDFKSGEDKIQLAGNAELYSLERFGSNTNIYFGDGDRRDLVAIIKSDSVSFASDLDFSEGQNSEFDIEFNFTDDNLSDTQIEIVEDAAERWSEIIVEDLPDVGDIDDLLIDVNTIAIDGEGDDERNILGQANNTEMRLDSSLPYEGFINLDIADIDRLEANNELEDLVLHEIGHVLGVGTLWDDFDLLTGAGGDDPRFIGAGATAEYNSIFGVDESSVPVENTGSPGTRDSHWRETDFDRELMTGFLDGGGNLPISRVTVASLGDLGYEVNLDAADNFITPKLDPRIDPDDTPIEIL